MIIRQAARAGTMESSDISVSVFPGGQGIEITLTSPVERQYGASIRASIRQVAEELGVEAAVIAAVDHGALDCTIRARTEAALRRGAAGGEGTE